MSLRERLNRVGGAGASAVEVTGAVVYLELARLDALLRGRVEQFNAKMMTATLPGVPAPLAFVNDFTIEDRGALESELFTASVVGGMLVGMGKTEGVIIDDDARGLGVRLNSAVSPVLAGLLNSFKETLDRAARVVLGGRAAGPLLALAE